MRKNGVMMQYFEWYCPDDGKHWERLKSDAGHLKELGINAIWIPPCYKATGTNDTGYGIYDAYDLGEFDQKGSIRTKYGTKEELHAAIDALHAEGIQVYADVVLNHRASADETETFYVVEVDSQDRNKVLGEAFEIEGWTKFTFPGRQNKYSDFQFNHTHFNGTDYNNRDGKTSIYLMAQQGKEWDKEVDKEFGNYDYLMYANIDYEVPEVREHTKEWLEWFVNETHVDGIRLDAIKHINYGFMKELTDFAMEKFGKDFFIVGEYWQGNVDTLENYLDNIDYNFDLFDVALHFNFYKAAKEGKSYPINKIFDNTLVQEKTTFAVTFVDNHDSQPQQALSSFVDRWFSPIAYSMILLRKDGYPCIFYGDYYGISGEHPVDPIREDLDKLLRLRSMNAYGDQVDYFDNDTVIAWVRYGDAEHPDGCAVVLSNGDVGDMQLNVGEGKGGQVWADQMGRMQDPVVIDDNGNGRFYAPAGNVAVYVRDVAREEEYYKQKEQQASADQDSRQDDQQEHKTQEEKEQQANQDQQELQKQQQQSMEQEQKKEEQAK